MSYPTAETTAPRVGRTHPGLLEAPPEVRRGRGWLMRRLLVAADVLALLVAFALTEVIFGSHGRVDVLSMKGEIIGFALTLPLWILGAKGFGLYDRDEERADHSTVDELVRVFLLMTVAVALVSRLAWVLGGPAPDEVKLTLFWGAGILAMAGSRAAARALGRRRPGYTQRTLIVGAGDVGQLVARKLMLHREYGMDLVGFVDASPRERRPFVARLPLLGSVDDLADIVRRCDIERVVFAFSRDQPSELIPIIRRLRDAGVRVDLVPRLFELVGPNVDLHTIEGLPLVGLPPIRIARTSLLMKRTVDIVGAGLAMIVLAPLIAAIGVLIKFDSPGPAVFRQRRLGKDMREFTVFKFRTMHRDTSQSAHQDYVRSVATSAADVGSNGLFKLDRSDAVTRVGRWLRKTSLDELPQLYNVLRGDMSLVGPRPCLRYELEHFATHHFDRFLVPAGITGLWQVSARAHSSFGEALDLDVLYAQSRTIGLDLLLLAKTPLQLLRSHGTT